MLPNGRFQRREKSCGRPISYVSVLRKKLRMLGRMNMGEMDLPANNRAIVRSAWKAAREDLKVETRPGYCLRTIRQIVQDAFEINHQQFYDRYRITVTTASPERTMSDVPWAADVERTMKIRNYALPLAYIKGGDIVFNYNAAAPVGHIAIMLDKNTVLENVDIRSRKHSVLLQSGLVLTPREHFEITLVARLP